MAAEHKLPLFYCKNKAVNLIHVNLVIMNRVSALLKKKLELPLLNKSQSEEDLQEQGNYEDVKQYINQHVLTDRNAVTMNVLHTIYGLWFYFVFNKTNYASYESYYLETLKTIENSYPGIKEIMKHNGLSAQGQDK